MKRTKYIFGLGLSIILSGIFFNSCTDANDWVVDSSFDRLFGTKQSSFNVTEGAVTAEVEWDATVNTKYYIIEASTDSLYDDIPMGAENSIVYGEDGSITQSPYTITGLMGETTYYLRIKSISEDKQSKWVYLPDYKFTTDKEQIFSEVAETEITDESVVLSWEAGLEVTHITYTQDGELLTYNITDDEKAAGKVTISGLSAMTEYVFYIYNGDILRGEQTVTTKEAVMVESSITDLKQNSAVFTWDTSVGRLTGYYFAAGETYPKEANNSLTDEQISSGRIELTGLEPNTTYTVAIMRDKTVRAMQTFKTEMGIPSDYTMIDVNSVDEWSSKLSSISSEKVAVVVNSDIELKEEYEFSSSIKSLLVLSDETLPVKPSIVIKGFRFGNDMDVVEFYNLNLKSVGSTSNYIFYFKNASSVKSLSVTSCDIDEARGVFRASSSATGKIENLSFTNCRMLNVGSYGLCTLEGEYEVASLNLSNCTYTPYNAASSATVKSKSSTQMNINIDYCTLYGFTYAILDDQKKATFNVSISNTLMGGFSVVKFFQNFDRGIIESCENVFLTSGSSFESSIGEEVIQYSDTDLFNNPTEYDFTVKVPEYKSYGDQYWNK